MRAFLDANILIAVLCNEYPLYTYCARVLSLADNPKFEIFTSPLCLAIAFYFAEKKNGTALAGRKIGIVSEKLSITTMDESAVTKTVRNKAISDFEDGLQYYSALNSKCKCIVTEDKTGFYFSEIEVLGSEEFLLAHAVKYKT